MKTNFNFFYQLENRAIIEIQGNDREIFLQGLITQDARLLEKEPILYSLMLSPQGKFQFDFFLVSISDAWLIDIDISRVQSFMQRLQIFKLRSDVDIKLRADFYVGVSSAKLNLPNCFLDPRLDELGYRFYGAKAATESSNNTYETLCLSLGVPDGARDMIIDKSIPLEWGMNELHAISWDKGCYMGQELTARSRYVGQIRKRIFPVTFDGSKGYSIGDKLHVNNQEVGELRAVNDNFGLAMLKIDTLQSCLKIDESTISVHRPSWMVLSE